MSNNNNGTTIQRVAKTSRRRRKAIKKVTKKKKNDRLYKAYFNALKAPEPIWMDEWADKNFFLPSESASEHGLWRTSRFPFLKTMMRKLSPYSRCEEVGVMKGAQVALTTMGIVWKFYTAEHCPGPFMYTLPTLENIEEYAEQKFNPSVDVCPIIQPLLTKLDTEEKYNSKAKKKFVITKKRKYYPGGYIAFTGANSPSSLRSKSIRYLEIDEEDGCKADLNNEGSAVYLATRRTANYPDSKILRYSTPILKETSSIEPFYLSGTQEKYLVHCPHCNPDKDKDGTYFHIIWDYIHCVDEDPETATLTCPVNGCCIEEYHKTEILKHGRWFRFNPTAKRKYRKDERRHKILVDIEKNKYHGVPLDDIKYLEETSIDYDDERRCTFHISSLYSPLGFYSWEKAADDFFTATRKNDKSLLKGFINTVLGETFRTNDDGIDYKGLKENLEILSPSGSFDVPQHCLAITTGVDVQKDRLELTTLAHAGEDEEYVIDYQVFYGETNIMGDGSYQYQDDLTSWGKLRDYIIHKTFTHESGHPMKIDCTFIDSRYRGKYVFKFTNAHASRNVFACQGQDGWGQGFVQRQTTANKYGVKVWKCMADELKDKVYSQLRNKVPGPNYITFSGTVDYPKGYFKGLVIEELKVKRKNGDDVYYWENPPGGRNEPLDTYVYAKGAYYSAKINLNARVRRFSTPYTKDYRKPQRRKRSPVASEGF